jgi:undecaprenyl-diphosphatase
MFISEKIFKFKKIKDINLVDAIIIGVCQSIALIPGVSRSGITISAGLFRGLEREASARFSFLLSTPIIAGATALHVRKMISSHIDYDLSLFLIGFISSAVTGVAAIKFLISFLKKYPLNIFVYYRFLLAVIIIAGLWIKG